MSKKVTRLFEQFQPENYELFLSPSPDSLTFSGSVIITGKKVGRPSQRITLHQKGLKISSAKLIDLFSNQQIELARINKHDGSDELRLHSVNKIKPGSYRIELEFSGHISDPMNGIYPCRFKHDGKNKLIIATQFESHHAREAFPCIDEPEAKATFDLSLESPKGQTAIANTPAISVTKKDTTQFTVFEKTPRMSTYLLAFVFGELDYKEAKTNDGIVVRTYATPDNVEHTAFALETAVKALEFYNDYFDIKYPLPKCDFVALPDFASGAMENWGLITFREQAMLVDPKNTSLHLKQYVANVVAHELTHQWFGNLVTMRWWTDLWLNESFASWMSWLAIDQIHPDWKVWTQFIVDEQSIALKLDALEHTHPIEVEVKHPDEIRTIFDAISYEKGASVLLMLHDYLGHQDFRDGLRLYLKRHSYSNTDTVDLWAALEEVSKKPVTEFMSAWTSQSGYPIVKVNKDKTNLSLEQSRFYLNPSAKRESTHWPIPLLSHPDIGTVTLDKAKLKVPAPATTVLLNHQRTSLYRAVYDDELTDELAKMIDQGSMDELDRLGLLADSIEASKAGYQSFTQSLDLLKHYNQESSSVVWDIIVGGIGSIRMVMGEDIRQDLRSFVEKLTLKQYERLGWVEQSGESHFDKLLRPTILGLATWSNNQDAVDHARKLFDMQKTAEDIQPDLRGAVYLTAARKGSSNEFKKMIKMHDSSINSEERVTLAAAICNFEQTELINAALAKITSGDVRLQDVAYWIAYCFSNPRARDVTWDWLINNWKWLKDNIGSDLSFFRMPLYAGRNYSDKDFIPEFEGFFKKQMSPAFERPVSQAIETIEWQSDWKQRDLTAIKTYLNKSN